MNKTLNQLILIISAIFILSGCDKNESEPFNGNIDAKWHIVMTQPNIFINSLYFTDTATGYAVGAFVDEAGFFVHGEILKTTDGGHNWVHYAADTMPGLSSVFFTSASTGFVVSLSSIYKTVDAGENWVTVFQGQNTFLESVYFCNPNIGFVVGISGQILKTTDGGQNWTFLNSGTTAQLRSVYFIDDQSGYVAGYQNETLNEFGFVLKTADGGETWDSVSTGQFLPGSITFTSKTTGFAACSTAILKTTDSGNHWVNVNNSGASGFVAISFATPETGFVVGQNGKIAKTIDGGQNWTTLPTNTFSLLTTVFFINQKCGYCAGFDWQTWAGTVLKWK